MGGIDFARAHATRAATDPQLPGQSHILYRSSARPLLLGRLDAGGDVLLHPLDRVF